MSGAVEVNQRPKCNSCQSQSFIICHWNLNSLVAHSFTKVPLLTAYLPIFLLISLILYVYQKLFLISKFYKFHIIYLSETFLNSEILTDHENLQIPCYSIARVDHPANTKRGNVFITKRHYL